MSKPDTRCSRCGWLGKTEELKGEVGQCPECFSTWQVDQLPDSYFTALQCADDDITRVGNEFDLVKLVRAMKKAGVTKPNSIRDGILTLHEQALCTARKFCELLIVRVLDDYLPEPVTVATYAPFLPVLDVPPVGPRFIATCPLCKHEEWGESALIAEGYLQNHLRDEHEEDQK